MFSRRFWSYVLALFLTSTVLALQLLAQSTVSGDVTGLVTDPSGAVVPKATVTLNNRDTGATSTTTTNTQGVYRFSLLQPGSYTVSVAAPGFQTTQHGANVTVGQASTVNVQMALASGSQTVEVTAEAGAVETQNGNITTTFGTSEIENVPNPGNDLSYIIQTAPGAVMNTQAGQGNSSIFGLPATSNLFTTNGMNDNDAFLNLNNSGATNLMLGQNDVDEVSVVNNGYTGEYGQFAGSSVNFVTKSGTNKYHGNAQYYWNGSALNANSFFNNSAGVPKAFDNANQWAASFGGPIVKNKTFFFINTEGLRVVLPTNTPVNVPSPQFQAATLSNLASVSPASIPFYQQMFNIWNNAPGVAGASTIPGGDPTGCNGFTGPNGLGTTTPCALQFRSTAGNFTHEWLLTARVDQNFGPNDRAFIHFRTDHGLQATYTDPLNSVFNAQSDQPQYEGQLNETHTISGNAVNQFIVSGSWYSAIFAPANLKAATALQPYRLRFAGRAFYDLGFELNDWPQGRNTTQYQISDDLSVQKGRHAVKFGVLFRRNDATNFDPGLFTTGESTGETLGNFFNGTGTSFIQNFPVRLSQPIAVYALGVYGQDEVAVTKNLKLTLALRAEHDSNPVCQTNCFARFATSFADISHDPNMPYNQTIVTGLHRAFRNYTTISWQPRLGFAWTPFGASRSTVIRGGVGLFSDTFPATVTDNFFNNSPLNNQFVVSGGFLAPGASGGGRVSQTASAAAANAAFSNGFASGGTLASISASTPAGVAFVPPSVFNASPFIHAPQYQEWNLEFQQGIGQKMTFSINYVGNHGIWEPVQNGGVNAFCNGPAPVPDGTSCLEQLGSTASSYGDLPLAAPDTRFGTVTEAQSAAISNYNGVTVSLQRRFSAVQFQANYTWSHALDEISNAGFLPFNFNTNESTLNPEDPFNIRRFNYGNADYDVRHYASLNYVWTTPRLSGWIGALASWTVSGTLFARSGIPFTATDANAAGILNGFNLGTTAGVNVFANSTVGPTNCDRGAVTTPCVSTSQFSPAVNGFGNQRRNQIYGPNFFDTDLSVMKNFALPHWEGSKLGIGFQFFNLFNHPNFDQPVGDINDPQFGLINRTVSVPTSIVGSFLGGDASPRMIQVKALLSF